MKKVLAILLGIVLLAASAYAASAYFVGRQVEATIGEPYKKLDHDPNVKLVKRDYQRGIFSSTEIVELELFGSMLGAMGRSPVVMTVKSVIKHGPAPGLSMLAAAVVETEIFVGAPQQKVLTSRSVIKHDGSGVANGVGPATAFDFQDPMTGASRRISWQAFTMAMTFASNMKLYTYRGDLPRIELSGDDGMRFTILGVQVTGDATQVFDDEPALHAGNQKVTIEEMSVKARFGAGGPFVMRKVAFDAATPVNGEFLNGTLKSTAAEVLIGKGNYGPAHFDMSLKNLHARSMAKLQKTMSTLNKPGQAAAANPIEAIQPLMEAGLELLQHNPELTIDRFSFTTPQGAVMIKAAVKMPGVTADDASNPEMLMQKLEAATDLAVPEALLMSQFGPTPVSVEAGNAQMQMRQKQIAKLVEQGYAIREGTMMKSKLEYRGGQVTVNGLPFDLMAMQQQPVETALMPPGAPRHPRGPAPMPIAR